ncbi:MAG: hypothetical protein AAGU76_00605 [Sedimentibacter sp.]|uniref:hypothetical protein n=1 Tax=Sedimentibacter sp. TaxID=1960295 RepID=UPI0031596756
MKKLFKECAAEKDIYESEDGTLNWCYIGDSQNFKDQITISDYYRILLVDNTGELTVDDLNSKIDELKNREGLLDYVDSAHELAEIMNMEYGLELEFSESLFYEDFDHFRHGYIVYDKEIKLFDLAENWEQSVTTYIYKEEHGYIAAMQVEIIDETTESSYPEIHIREIDEIEELEAEESQDEDDDEKEFVIIEKKVVETTSVKKLCEDRFLITVSSKLAGHLDMAAISTEEELKRFLEEEGVVHLDEYLHKINSVTDN